MAVLRTAVWSKYKWPECVLPISDFRLCACGYSFLIMFALLGRVFLPGVSVCICVFRRLSRRLSTALFPCQFRCDRAWLLVGFLGWYCPAIPDPNCGTDRASLQSLAFSNGNSHLIKSPIDEFLHFICFTLWQPALLRSSLHYTKAFKRNGYDWNPSRDPLDSVYAPLGDLHQDPCKLSSPDIVWDSATSFLNNFTQSLLAHRLPDDNWGNLLISMPSGSNNRDQHGANVQLLPGDNQVNSSSAMPSGSNERDQHGVNGQLLLPGNNLVNSLSSMPSVSKRRPGISF
ncbi:uncharacterized protein LOC120123049 [Hibiscus syriacus]|uniref:uncharacterized protein LOC120123049 n=1 Tax=Hibiscus syriacus TaxID=106335 RepID=UPI00192355E0|nr:uncharacterized protein LOC120123049 [Hibiscus syriacus]